MFQWVFQRVIWKSSNVEIKFFLIWGMKFGDDPFFFLASSYMLKNSDKTLDYCWMCSEFTVKTIQPRFSDILIVKGAAKLYFMHYSRVIFICSIRLCIRLYFLLILFVKLGFHLSVFWFFLFCNFRFHFSVLCFEFDVISHLHNQSCALWFFTHFIQMAC